MRRLKKGKKLRNPVEWRGQQLRITQEMGPMAGVKEGSRIIQGERTMGPVIKDDLGPPPGG